MCEERGGEAGRRREVDEEGMIDLVMLDWVGGCECGCGWLIVVVRMDGRGF